MKIIQVALLSLFSLVCVAVLPIGSANAAKQTQEPALRSPTQGENVPIAAGLSDFEWFRVFPYVDKSYTLAANGRLEEAITEVERAREIVPDHLPLLLHHVELLIESGNPQRAFEKLQPYLADPQARHVYAALLGRSDRIAELSEAQFFVELERLEAHQKAVFASAYLDVHGHSLSKAELVRLADAFDSEQLHPELSSQLAEYLFGQEGADEVVTLLEPLCRDSINCHARQRRQLIQAMVLSANFEGIAQWLMSFEGHEFDDMLSATASRMIGAQHTEQLIELLVLIDKQRSLDQAWGLVLYRLAADNDEVPLALSLAQRFPVNCLAHTELLIEDGQTERASDLLSQCRPATHEEGRYIVLAQQLGGAELLENVPLSSAEAERTRVGLLADHYTATRQREKLIGLLQRYEHRDQDLQHLLTQAYYENGQTEQALALSAQGWQRNRDVASLDYHTYILLNEQRYEDLLHLAVNERWADKRTQLGASDIGARLRVGIEHAHSGTASEALVAAAQRWPQPNVAAQVSDVLIQRQDCESVAAIRQQLNGVVRHHADSYCLPTAAERLEALERFRSDWNDSEWLRGAVLAYETGDHDKSLTYLQNLSTEVAQHEYKSLELSALLASGQGGEAWARWRALREPMTEDEIIVGVEIALNRDDRESVTAALQRIQPSDYQRTALPLRLRLAEMDDDLHQQLSLFERLAEDNPDDAYYLLAQAYVHERLGHYGAAGRIYDQAFDIYPDTRNIRHLGQAAYINAVARRDKLAKQQLHDVIDMGYEQGVEHTQTIAESQRLYRQVDSPFQVSAAGWVGQSTNVSEVTGNDFQADYFVSTMLEYDLDYGRERHTNLSLFANLLSAGDSFFFDNNSLDIGVAWQPFTEHLSFLRMATRTSFDGDGTRLYLRGSTDLLAGYNAEKQWAGDQRLVQQSLYLDWIFFPDEQTSGFYGRYQPTFQFAGTQRSFSMFGAYPFFQYQWTNDTIGQERLTDTRAGLGITWRQPWGRSRYSGWHAFSEVGLEWQHVLDSDIAGVSDNGLLLRFAVYF